MGATVLGAVNLFASLITNFFIFANFEGDWYFAGGTAVGVGSRCLIFGLIFSARRPGFACHTESVTALNHTLMSESTSFVGKVYALEVGEYSQKLERASPAPSCKLCKNAGPLAADPLDCSQLSTLRSCQEDLAGSYPNETPPVSIVPACTGVRPAHPLRRPSVVSRKGVSREERML